MRIGVISDIHNNPAALRAVLTEFAKGDVQGIICLGDIIGIGPLPQETVELVMGIPDMLACVRGNHEGYLIDGRYDDMDNEEREFHLWEHARLNDMARQFLAGLDMEARLEIEGVRIWAGHYPMEDGRYADIDAERTVEICPDAHVCLYGHDHARHIVEKQGRILADFGSLGCPGSDKNIARAGIIEVFAGSAKVYAVDVEYDVESVIKVMDELDPPARKTVQKIFYGR